MTKTETNTGPMDTELTAPDAANPPDGQRLGTDQLSRTEGNPAEQETEVRETVDGITVVTAKDAIKVLKDGKKRRKKREKKGEDPSVSIADETIKDPETAYRTFLEAIALVKKHVPGFLRFRIEQIRFQKLAGDIVGKSTEEGIFVDPVMLLHPVMRLATTIFHEALHNDNRVQNEGLVQTQTEMYFQGMETTETYEAAVARFTRFADIYGKGKIGKSTAAIYKLYYKASKDGNSKHYEQIYTTFMKRAKKSGYFRGEADAHKFFTEVFPELKITGKFEDQQSGQEDLPLAA